MSVYQITIFDNEKEEINPLFVRANGKLLKQYDALFRDYFDFPQKVDLLEALWKKDYKAQLVKTGDIHIPWDKIEFESQEDMMLFLLKMG